MIFLPNKYIEGDCVCEEQCIWLRVSEGHDNTSHILCKMMLFYALCINRCTVIGKCKLQNIMDKN